MPEPEQTKERITVYVPGNLKKEIEASAAEAGQTLTVWFERASRKYLEASHGHV